MPLRLHNSSRRAMLLKTDEADEVLNITENTTNSITQTSLLPVILLRFGLLHLSSGEFFLNISLKNFSKHSEWLVLEEMSVRSDSEGHGNINSV